MSSAEDHPPAVPPLAVNIGALFDALVRALHAALPEAGFGDIRPAHSINLFRVIDGVGPWLAFGLLLLSDEITLLNQYSFQAPFNL